MDTLTSQCSRCFQWKSSRAFPSTASGSVRSVCYPLNRVGSGSRRSFPHNINRLSHFPSLLRTPKIFMCSLEEKGNYLSDSKGDINPAETCIYNPKYSFVENVARWIRPCGFTIKGFIRERPIHILIDSGITKSLLDPTTAKECGYLLETMSPAASICAGNSSIFSSKLPNFTWEMQGHTFQTDVNILSLGGELDMILGLEWMFELSAMEFQPSLLTFTCTKEGREIILNGESNGFRLEDYHRRLYRMHFNGLNNVTLGTDLDCSC